MTPKFARVALVAIGLLSLCGLAAAQTPAPKTSTISVTPSTHCMIRR